MVNLLPVKLLVVSTTVPDLLREGITQSVECDTFNIEVVGSSPTALIILVAD
jgi:hypothetical protein